MKMTKLMAVLMATSVVSASAYAETSQQRQPAQTQARAATPTVPAGLISKAIAQNSEKTGRVAAAPLGSGRFIVYLKTQNNCGTGGCGADIWAFNGKDYQRVGDLPVGYLPIRQLPETDNGMPRLAITVYEKAGPATLVPVIFNGREYMADWSKTLPANSGKVILSDNMLKAF